MLNWLFLGWTTYDGTDATLPENTGLYIFKLNVSGCDNNDNLNEDLSFQIVRHIKNKGFIEFFAPQAGDKWLEVPSEELCENLYELINRYQSITSFNCPCDLNQEICVKGDRQDCQLTGERKDAYFECWNIYFSYIEKSFIPLKKKKISEVFKCRQCGRCCLTLAGAAETSCRDEDWNRWLKEKRFDILSRIETIKIKGHVFARDMWFKLRRDGRRGEMVDRCPWLRKSGDRYFCRIHNTKPGHCREFTPSPELARKIGCPGWDDD